MAQNKKQKSPLYVNSQADFEAGVGVLGRFHRFGLGVVGSPLLQGALVRHAPLGIIEIGVQQQPNRCVLYAEQLQAGIELRMDIGLKRTPCAVLHVHALV